MLKVNIAVQHPQIRYEMKKLSIGEKLDPRPA